jgi:hypothetical protein
MPPSAEGRLGWFRLPPRGEGFYTGLDWLRGKTSDKAPPNLYRIGPSSFELDYSFLDKPGAQPVDCVDRLKRIPLWPSDSPWEHNLVTELQLGRHSLLVFGYSKLLSGNFITETGVQTNPEMFYAQYYFRW